MGEVHEVWCLSSPNSPVYVSDSEEDALAWLIIIHCCKPPGNTYSQLDIHHRYCLDGGWWASNHYRTRDGMNFRPWSGSLGNRYRWLDDPNL